MARFLKGNHRGEGLRVAVVVARFNEFVTSRLLDGALEGLKSHGVGSRDIVVVWVPGCFEIPPVAERLAQRGDCDAIVCLGAVIRHETDHYRYVAEQAAMGVASVARETEIPVIFGVLTTDTDEQALARAGGEEGNKGYDAALAAIEMASVLAMVEEIHD